ncbi:MAG: hypothetical protein HDT06_06845 [Bacteroidales bacterium]|nr:hypothetical protein [Bacteroidales bacterium]
MANFLDLDDGGTQYLATRLSLNTLKECVINSFDVPNCKFGLKITQKSHNFEYGTHYYYQIEVIVDGKYEDIDIEGTKISYLIDYKYTLYRSYNQFYHTYTFHGIKNNGEEFTISLETIYSSNMIVSIIFALIFMSEFNDIDKMKEIWQFLFDRGRVEIGKSITLLIESVEKSKDLINKYPIMKKTLEQQIKERTSVVKDELSKLTILQ